MSNQKDSGNRTGGDKAPPPLGFSPADPQNHRCPHDNYNAIYGRSPVFFDPDRNSYWVTRHDLIEMINRNPQTFSSQVDLFEGTRAQGYPEEAKRIRAEGIPRVDTLLTNNDPDTHWAYRQLVNKAFMPRRVRMIEQEIEELAQSLIADFPETGEVEFSSQFAVPLTFTVIARQLGVPTDMLPTFKKWSDSIDALISSMGEEERLIEAARDERDMQDFLIEQCEMRRADPQEDIISDIATAQFKDERPLTAGELYSILTQLFVAGNESTRSTLMGAVYYISQNPGIVQKLRDGGRPAVKVFVEEILRLWSAVQGLYRQVQHDTEIEGVAIPKGAIVHIRYAAANIDPAVFSSPLEIDLDRPNTARHMAFGHGPHFCIGAALARQELITAIEQLFSRYGGVEVIKPMEELEFFPSYHLRCLSALDVRFSK